jgi:hypothetical protein
MPEKSKAPFSLEAEHELRKEFLKLFRNSPIPEEELFANLGLYLSRHHLSRILTISSLYKKILNVHGNIIEFGCRWGQNLALFSSLRAMYEPYKLTRKIIGFDTFSGFPSVHEKDGKAGVTHKGSYTTTKDYEQYLDKIMDFHEKINPNSHVKKYSLIKGDLTKEAKSFFAKNPETIVALAYFDLDIYEPTKKCLEILKNYVTRGSVIVFDELNFPEHPGETIALKEAWGLDKYSIQRDPDSQHISYIIID